MTIDTIEVQQKKCIQINDYFLDVMREIEMVQGKWSPFNSSHEGYAVILEELDEVWDDIKANDITHSRKEMIQVIAMGFKYLTDVKA